jgi:UDP-glucose 4-epimerase
MKKILITGGAGYIGAATVQYFIKKNFIVYVVDNNITGKNFIKNKNCFYYKTDYFSQKTFEIIEKNNISNIIHLAGYIDSNESVYKPKKYLNNNFIKLKKFIKVCEKLNVQKIVFSSSAAVYGNTLSGKIINENSRLSPISPYGKSKLLAEKFLCKSNLKVVVLRYFNVAGPTFNLEYNQNFKSYKHLLKKLLEVELSTKKKHNFYINGIDYATKDGTCVRDFIHVQDVAMINYHSIFFKFKNNLILNCGSSNPTSVKSVVTKFLRYSKKKIDVKIGPNRKGDPAFLLSNNLKLLSKYKFKLKNINIIIKDTFKYINKINNIKNRH